MDTQLINKLDELFKLLDNLDCIKNLERIKNINDPILLELINKYRNNPSIENKKELYKNELFLEYIKNEQELNYLIMEINNKFKRGNNCENNKW